MILVIALVIYISFIFYSKKFIEEKYYELEEEKVKIRKNDYFFLIVGGLLIAVLAIFKQYNMALCLSGAIPLVFQDEKRTLMSDLLNFIFTVIAFIYAIYFQNSIAGAGLITLTFAMMHFYIGSLTYFFTKDEEYTGLGGGDVKFSFPVALFFIEQNNFGSYILNFCSIYIVAMVFVILSKLNGSNEKTVPFAKNILLGIIFYDFFLKHIFN